MAWPFNPLHTFNKTLNLKQYSTSSKCSKARTEEICYLFPHSSKKPGSSV